MFTVTNSAVSLPQYRGISLINNLALKNVQINKIKFIKGHLAVVYNKKYLCLFDAVNLPTSEYLLSRIEAAILTDQNSIISPILIFSSEKLLSDFIFINLEKSLYLLIIDNELCVTLFIWSLETLCWEKVGESSLKCYSTTILKCGFIPNASDQSYILGQFYFVDIDHSLFISTLKVFLDSQCFNPIISFSNPIQLLRDSPYLLISKALSYLILYADKQIYSIDAISCIFQSHDFNHGQKLFYESENGSIYVLNICDSSKLYVLGQDKKFHELVTLSLSNFRDILSFAVVSTSLLINIAGVVFVFNMFDGTFLKVIDIKYKIINMFPIGFGLIGVCDSYNISILSPDSIKNQFLFLNHKFSTYNLIKSNWGISSIPLLLYQFLYKKEINTLFFSTTFIFNIIIPFLRSNYRVPLDFNSILIHISQPELSFQRFSFLNNLTMPLISRLYQMKSKLYERCDSLTLPFNSDFISLLSRRNIFIASFLDSSLNPLPTYLRREPKNNVENMWTNSSKSIIETANILSIERTFNCDDSLESLNFLSKFVGIPVLNITEYTNFNEFLFKVNEIWPLEKLISLRSSIFIMKENSFLESSPYLEKLIILYYEHYPIALPMLLSVLSYLLVLNQNSSLVFDFSMQFISINNDSVLFKIPFYLSLLNDHFQYLSSKNSISLEVPFYFRSNPSRIISIAQFAYKVLQQKCKLDKFSNDYQLDAFIWILVCCNNLREAIDLKLICGGFKQEIAALELVSSAFPKSLQYELFVKFARYILESPVLNEIHMKERQDIIFSKKFKISAPSNFSAVFYVQTLQRELSIFSEELLNNRSKLISCFLSSMLT